jgi:hypothetical protein
MLFYVVLLLYLAESLRLYKPSHILLFTLSSTKNIDLLSISQIFVQIMSFIIAIILYWQVATQSVKSYYAIIIRLQAENLQYTRRRLLDCLSCRLLILVIDDII